MDDSSYRLAEELQSCLEYNGIQTHMDDINSGFNEEFKSCLEPEIPNVKEMTQKFRLSNQKKNKKSK